MSDEDNDSRFFVVGIGTDLYPDDVGIVLHPDVLTITEREVFSAMVKGCTVALEINQIPFRRRRQKGLPVFLSGPRDVAICVRFNRYNTLFFALEERDETIFAVRTFPVQMIFSGSDHVDVRLRDHGDVEDFAPLAIGDRALFADQGRFLEALRAAFKAAVETLLPDSYYYLLTPEEEVEHREPHYRHGMDQTRFDAAFRALVDLCPEDVDEGVFGATGVPPWSSRPPSSRHGYTTCITTGDNAVAHVTSTVTNERGRLVACLLLDHYRPTAWVTHIDHAMRGRREGVFVACSPEGRSELQRAHDIATLRDLCLDDIMKRDPGLARFLLDRTGLVPLGPIIDHQGGEPS